MSRRARGRAPLAPHHAGAFGVLLRYVVALGLLLAQGPVLLHLLLVPHATCEHGELVEIASSAGHDTDAHSATKSVASPSIEVTHEGGGAHDHCDALALRHRVSELGARVAQASLLAVLPLEDGGDGAEVRPVALLWLAPKASPPRA